MTKAIGIFGGTFDPIHDGHLQVAIEAYKQLALQEVRLIPCHQSPFKKLPIATPEQRATMIKLAIANYPYLQLDSRELERGGISYSVDTLRSLRLDYPATPLCLLLSADAFAKFEQWHKWQQILTMTHLVVANRPNSQSIQGNRLLKQHQVTDPKQLQHSLAGAIYLLTNTPKEISATKIRELIAKNQPITSYTKRSVNRFITENNLYHKKTK